MPGSLQYVWDEVKRHSNATVHGIDFTDVFRFEWDTARVDPDTRRDYGESRLIALGRIGGRVHVLIFTRRGEQIRVISLRKANRREIRQYEESQSQK